MTHPSVIAVFSISLRCSFELPNKALHSDSYGSAANKGWYCMTLAAAEF